jgi:hypothetical protein
MKNILKFFLIVFLISNHSCTKNENFNQKQKTIIESIELGKFYRNFENQIDNGKYNNQIDSDIFISKQFTEQEILQLCNNKNPRIRVVFFGALCQKNLNKAFDLFIKNIDDREMFTWGEMFLEKDYDTSNGPVIQKWYYKINDLINETQQVRFGNLLIKNYNHKKYAIFYDNYLNYIANPPKSMLSKNLYKHIKDRLSKNDIPLYKGNNSEKIYLVMGLSNFKNENDVLYIKRILENLLVSENYYMIDIIISNFPHSSFFPIFTEYYEKNKEWCVENARKTIEVLNQYPNTKSKQLIEDVLKNYDFHTEHFYGNKYPNMTKEKYVKTIVYSELSHPYFSDIKDKIKTQIDYKILENLKTVDNYKRTY